jgi:leucyl-tRNA synthetase
VSCSASSAPIPSSFVASRPESIKEMQRNWIGRSVGVSLGFEVADGVNAGQVIDVFTTRVDTLFGVTYLVVAPEHPLALTLATDGRQEAVSAYVESASRKNDLERTELAKEKSGVWTGAFARNPASGELVPVWVADYVLGGYGTGAVMAVPAHDARDYEFATRFALPIRAVVRDMSGSGDVQLPLTEPGIAVNSCNSANGLSLDGACWQICSRLPFSLCTWSSGLTTDAAADAVATWLEARSLGSRRVNYKLRDWLFARQVR